MADASGSFHVVQVVALPGAAVVAVSLFKRLGLGTVLGYLAAGLIIGPSGFGLFQDASTILHIAGLGVVIFLFVIGLEMESAHLWHLRRQIFGLGSMQVVLAAVLLTAVGILYGFLLARSKAREVMTAAALLVVLGSGQLLELGGLSMAMGAFLAGVLLSDSSFRHQLEADVEPFRGLLLGLFFLAVGMSLNLRVVAEHWLPVASGVLAMMAAKGLCIYGVARLAKSSHDEALERAVLMAQGGEFAFVLYAAAYNQGVIGETENATMTACVVLSMILTPLFFTLLHARLPQKAVPACAADVIEERHEVLQIGFGRFGQIVYYSKLSL